jgi:hypothetical protein
MLFSILRLLLAPAGFRDDRETGGKIVCTPCFSCWGGAVHLAAVVLIEGRTAFWEDLAGFLSFFSWDIDAIW